MTQEHPAILSNGATPSLNTGISAAEVRSLIGAGTSSTVGTVTSVTSTIDGNSLVVAVASGTTTPAVNFDWNGSASQYVNGEGNLTTFPNIPQGDITSVTAGTNMSGGGTSGAVTLNANGTNLTYARGASNFDLYSSTGTDTLLVNRHTLTSCRCYCIRDCYSSKSNFWRKKIIY